MGSPPRKPSGRVVHDDRGNPTWEWRIDTGTFASDIDTQRLRQLQEEAERALAPPAPGASGHNPYDTGGSAPERERRRTLDDMRRLSEEIKRRRAAKESK